MSTDIHWKIVKRSGRPIGGIGFVDSKAAIVVAFYEDADANYDGNVSKVEWFVTNILSPIRIKGRAVAEVAAQAKGDPDILEIDQEFGDMVARRLQDFAMPAITDAMFHACLGTMVARTARGFAMNATEGLVKQFIIKKGLETAVKKAVTEGLKG